MDLSRMSESIVVMIDEILKNQKIVNLVGSSKSLPLTEDVPPASIAPMSKNQRITAYPFDIDYLGDVRTELRIYYPEFRFLNNNHVNETIVIVDIIVHKDIWLMSNDGKKVIRPYVIADEIFKHFKHRNVQRLGKLHFIDGAHVMINSEFEAVRLTAKLTDF
jgi:hypothetical protein